MGLSVDRTASLKAWAGSLGGIAYPLLADFWPHGEVCQAYGVFNDQSGSARRSLIIVDKDGVVRHTETHQGTLPDPVKTVEVLDRLRGG